MLLCTLYSPDWGVSSSCIHVVGFSCAADGPRCRGVRQGVCRCPGWGTSRSGACAVCGGPLVQFRLQSSFSAV